MMMWKRKVQNKTIDTFFRFFPFAAVDRSHIVPSEQRSARHTIYEIEQACDSTGCVRVLPE